MTEAIIGIMGILQVFTVIGVVMVKWKLDDIMNLMRANSHYNVNISEQAWKEIVDDIKTCDDVALELGDSDMNYLDRHVIYIDLLKRFANGERSHELYKDMLRVDLIKKHQ